MSESGLRGPSRQEMLDSLVEYALLPDKFFMVKRGAPSDSYVGSSPMKSLKKISCGGIDYVDKLGNIVNLGLADQTYLNKRLSEKFGVNLKYGSLVDHVKASGMESAREYIMSSLVPYSVYTGHVVRKLSAGFEVRKVADAVFSESDPNPRLVLSDAVLQKTVPSVSGYCSNLSSEVPNDSDFSDEDTIRDFSDDGILYFSSIIFDKAGLSSVNVSWGSSVNALFGGGSPTSQDYHFGTTVPVWTDDDMRK